MSTSSISFNSSNPPPLPIHRFTVEEYHRLGELGVLQPEHRVELLEGWIVEKMNQRPAHGFVVRMLDNWLQSNVPEGWITQCQLPITLADSEPEPDLAVIKGTHSDFRDRHPGTRDCRLLIEVADTSLLKDRAKAAIYAAAGVPEYWIIDLNDGALEKMMRPEGSSYSESITLGSNDEVETQIGDRTIRFSLKTLFEKMDA